MLAVTVLARVQTKYSVHGTRLSCTENQSGLRWMESDVDLLAKLTCLRHCNTSEAARPLKQRWVCVDGLTGVIKSSSICGS
jgi:hypothetical protein